jgi:PKD repeat protein/alpha-tubulin suppressor-like RCC1 family protein
MRHPTAQPFNRRGREILTPVRRVLVLGLLSSMALAYRPYIDDITASPHAVNQTGSDQVVISCVAVDIDLPAISTLEFTIATYGYEGYNPLCTGVADGGTCAGTGTTLEVSQSGDSYTFSVAWNPSPSLVDYVHAVSCTAYATDGYGSLVETGVVELDSRPPEAFVITSVALDDSAPYWDLTNEGPNATQAVFSVEDAIACRWATTDLDYSAMTNACASTTSCALTGATVGGQTYTYTIACIDNANNGNTSADNLHVTWQNRFDIVTGVVGVTPSNTVVDFATAPGMASVAAPRGSPSAGCAILENHTTKCWGGGPEGVPGLGDTLARGDVPGEMGDNLPAVELGAGRFATTLSVGVHHACAILDDLSLKCWGTNTYGELGLGDTLRRGDAPAEMGDFLPAVDLGSSRHATDIAAGEYHTCALLETGGVACWGASSKLGMGPATPAGNIGDAPGEMGDSLPEVDLGGGRYATAVTASSTHTCALLDNHAVKCWGLNTYGQLGLGDTATRGDDLGEMGDNLPAVDFGSGRYATAVTVGPSFGCALLDNFAVKCWGLNTAGQLGLGSAGNRGDQVDEMGDNLPEVRLGAGRYALQLSAGTSHACALLDDGAAKCWGNNSNGELGRGNTSIAGLTPQSMGDGLLPVSVGTGRRSVDLVGAAGRSCVLLDNGANKCWGSNSLGALGIGDVLNRGDTAGEMGDALPRTDLGAKLRVTCSFYDTELRAPSAFDVTLRARRPDNATLITLCDGKSHGEACDGAVGAGTLSVSAMVPYRATVSWEPPAGSNHGAYDFECSVFDTVGGHSVGASTFASNSDLVVFGAGPGPLTLLSVAGDVSHPYRDLINEDPNETLVTFSAPGAASCRWAATDLDYASMTNPCESTSACTLTGTALDLEWNRRTIACVDASGVGNTAAGNLLVEWQNHFSAFLDTPLVTSVTTSSVFVDPTLPAAGGLEVSCDVTQPGTRSLFLDVTLRVRHPDDTTVTTLCDAKRAGQVCDAALGAGVLFITDASPYTATVAWDPPDDYPDGHYDVECVVSDRWTEGNSDTSSFATNPDVVTFLRVPSVVTLPATFVAGKKATLNGEANPNGGTATAWFRYATTNPGTCNNTFGVSAPTSATALGSGSTAVPLAEPLIALPPNTTYFYCAIARNGSGTSFGQMQSFTTLTPTAPAVTTVAATAVNFGSATLNGEVNPNNDDTVGWFRYDSALPGACDDTFGIRVPVSSGTAMGFGGTAVPLSASVSSLAPGTAYYFCAIANNSMGLSFGTLRMFMTAANCTPTGLPETLCNAVDDDCDTQVDEDYSGSATTCGTGVCAGTGQWICVAGTPINTCTAGGATGLDDNCNGVDEDCDAQIDEHYLAVASSCGTGTCARTGEWLCVAGTPVDTCTPCSNACQDVSECHDTDPCTIDLCTGGSCQNPPAPDGFPCDDQNSCSKDDACQDAVCTGGAATVVPECGAALAISALAAPNDNPAPLDASFLGTCTPADHIINYAWSFGDDTPAESGFGLTSTSHLYPIAGGYTARLTCEVLWDDGSTEEKRTTIPIRVSEAGQLPPVAIIQASATEGAETLSVSFACDCVAGTSAISATLWDFADGTRSAELAPTHTFGPGVFNVTLTVMDEAGLVGSDSAVILVSSNGRYPPQVTISASPASGEAPLSVQFDGTAVDIDDDVDVSSFTWLIEEQTLEDASPSWTFDNAGFFTVMLSVTDLSGLVGTDQVEIEVSAGTMRPPKILSLPNTEACGGEPYSYDEDGKPSARGSNVSWDLGKWVNVEKVGRPAGMDIVLGTGQIVWTPSLEQVGNQWVVLVAQNSAAADLQEFTIRVIDCRENGPDGADDQISSGVGCACSDGSVQPGSPPEMAGSTRARTGLGGLAKSVSQKA